MRLSEAINLPRAYNPDAKGGNVVHSLVEVLLVELQQGYQIGSAHGVAGHTS